MSYCIPWVALGAEMCVSTEGVLLYCVHIIHCVKRIHIPKTNSSEINESLQGNKHHLDKYLSIYLL